MPNLIINATGLDGLTDWTFAGGGTIDETVLGSPGRAVLKAAGAAILTSFAATPGATLSVSAYHRPGSSLIIQTDNGAGGAVVETAVPLIRAGKGPPRRGLPATFAFSKGSAVIPAGHVRAVLASVAAAGPVFMLQPYASTSGFRCWTPGPHTSLDLNLASWPDTLPDFKELDSPRTPTRKSFATDSGIPASWRIGTRGRIMFEGSLTLDLEQLDTLERFVESRLLLAESVPFWFVHPDTRQLCRAWFNPDNEISNSGRGRERSTMVSLILEVA